MRRGNFLSVSLVVALTCLLTTASQASTKIVCDTRSEFDADKTIYQFMFVIDDKKKSVVDPSGVLPLEVVSFTAEKIVIHTIQNTDDGIADACVLLDRETGWMSLFQSRKPRQGTAACKALTGMSLLVKGNCEVMQGKF